MKRRRFVHKLVLIAGTALTSSGLSANVVEHYEYEPDKIYTIKTGLGITTQIELSPSEKILDYSTGFSSGWDLTRREHVFYIRPKDVDVDTNMVMQSNLSRRALNGKPSVLGTITSAATLKIALSNAD